MPKSFKLLAILGVLVGLAACANETEEVVIVEPEPISTEPVYTGPYK